jgi:hypothetical protein
MMTAVVLLSKRTELPWYLDVILYGILLFQTEGPDAGQAQPQESALGTLGQARGGLESDSSQSSGDARLSLVCQVGVVVIC